MLLNKCNYLVLSDTLFDKQKTQQRKSQKEKYTFSTFDIFPKLNLTAILL